jgi:hypothetical protein
VRPALAALADGAAAFARPAADPAAAPSWEELVGAYARGAHSSHWMRLSLAALLAFSRPVRRSGLGCRSLSARRLAIGWGRRRALGESRDPAHRREPGF